MWNNKRNVSSKTELCNLHNFVLQLMTFIGDSDSQRQCTMQNGGPIVTKNETHQLNCNIQKILNY